MSRNRYICFPNIYFETIACEHLIGAGVKPEYLNDDKLGRVLEVNSLIVADSALYTESNLKMMSELSWLCRVPVSIKTAKSLILTIPESEFIDSKIPVQIS
ncbi:DUF4277 domain-containing protein [Cylindrospermopsis raciborskii DSH]|uniref:DUF4277 domain-containing protein n=1 Tax=Cylindrospermopsis raciborskii TaxID=77022 RepID=UPI002ED8D97A